MGRLEDEFQKCLSSGKISVFKDANKLVKKQVEIASGDLKEALGGLERGRWKWSTIQAYYSMFHTARAFLYAKGFREKHHRCLRIAVSYLYSAEGGSFERFMEDLHLAKQMRENADYSNDFSENGARKMVKRAAEFIEEAKKIIKL